MIAGRELDALVAEKVMGWSAVKNKNGYSEVDYALMGGGLMSRDSGWSPSENLEHIWDVVDQMRKDGFSFTCFQPSSFRNTTIVSFICPMGPCEKHGNPNSTHHGAYDVEAETAPLAVCRAALMALKVGI